MNWWHGKRASVARDSKFASSEDFAEAFKRQHEELLWLAEVITGDIAVANQCVIDARAISSNHSTVFRDWLGQWARTATVRSAIQSTRDQIEALLPFYSDENCPQSWRGTLTESQVGALQQMSPSQITAALDPFARAVIVVHGLQRAALQECAITFGAPRSAIAAAYWRACTWLARQMQKPESYTLSASA